MQPADSDYRISPQLSRRLCSSSMSSVFARPLIIFGIILLCHAYVTQGAPREEKSPLIRRVLIRCYSAFEHSTLASLSSRPSSLGPSSTNKSGSPSLPLDISLETIVSVAFICIGLVSGAEELKPINWRVWAGKAERESGGGGPYQGLEDRMGFVDIRVSTRSTPNPTLSLQRRTSTASIDCRRKDDQLTVARIGKEERIRRLGP